MKLKLADFGDAVQLGPDKNTEGHEIGVVVCFGVQKRFVGCDGEPLQTCGPLAPR